MSASTHRNRLASESSAYLLQHAANPVDWYPWGDEALGLAKRLDRPILLSVGYSACHWCHVMERESFENPEIASLMNASFVCIKVDREERPDVDHLYMKALQGMTGRGGWPMTMFLTPDARPFYAGTYFPPEDRGGMPGFPRVLVGVAKTWAEEHEKVLDSATRVTDYLAGDRTSRRAGSAWTREALHEAALSLAGAMDTEHGGFGRAPKFPGTMALSLLMEADREAPDDVRRSLIRLSLDRMAAGGIRDHLGGGFHRYSVDREWLVPHFEKMLYDQALLVRLYTDASAFFADPAYAYVAEEILDYVVREMTSEDGGFFSAQDADSEGEEGRYFLWTRGEIEELLGAGRAALFCAAYGVSEGGNFEGRTILHRVLADAELARSFRRDEGSIEADLAQMRADLLRRREGRVRPGTDRKIVADWNSLMLGAMAVAGDALGRDDLVEAAVRAASFVRTRLVEGETLYHVHAGGVAKVPGFLDDYAFFGRACLDLFRVRAQREHFEAAVWCARRLLEEYEDADAGGFFFVGARSDALVARTCDLYDGAVPAGNSVAADLMQQLWTLTGEEPYRRAAERVLERFLGEGQRYPYGAAYALSVAEHARRGLRTVVIVGDEAGRQALSRAAKSAYDPATTVVSLSGHADDWLPPALAGKSAPADGACAYVCEGSTCSMPIRRPQEIAERIASRSSASE